MARVKAEARSQNAAGRMRRMRAGLGLGLLLLALAGPAARAEDHAIIMTGGDANQEIADWRNGLADKFEAEFKKRSGDTSEVTRADEPSEVEAAIKGLKGKVQCGEDVVIYFNGHGGSTGRLYFYVRKGRAVSEKSVSPEDVLKWLKEAALPCSARVHLVIHACYSGEFIEKVAKGDVHVVTAVSSSTDTRPAHKDVRSDGAGGVAFDGNDWPTGFNEDLEKVAPGTEWQPAIQEAKKSAKEKMRDKWEEKDKPQTWKRFKNCHVVEVTLDEKSGRKTVKLACPDGSERTVVMLPGSKLKLGKEELDYCVLTVCSWITPLVQESDKGEYEVRDCVASVNISGATGHVQSVDRDKGTFTMHFDAPPHLKCKIREVKVPPGAALPDWLRYCKWVRLDSTYHDSTGITAGGVTETEPPVIRIKGHVQAANPATGEFEVHIWGPDWLRCTTRKARVRPGEKLPRWMRKCKWVRFDGRLGESIVDATGITEEPPVSMGYKGHVREVKGGLVTIHVQDPAWLLCEIKVLRPPRGTAIPDWVKPCTTVFVQGPLTGDTIELQDFGMGSVFRGTARPDFRFTAHVESVGRDYVVVTISEPERMKGQRRRMKLAPGQKIPDGVEFCQNITFTGNIIYDSIINGRDIRLVGTPVKNDAGSQRIITPGAEVPAHARVTPEVEVRNFGTAAIAVLPVFCSVESAGVQVFADSGSVNDLGAGASAAIAFRAWPAAGPGALYDLGFRTRLAGDEDPTNDAVSAVVTVVQSQNQAPTLSQGKVEPPAGLPGAQFRFAVVYTDPDGDMPVAHQVLVNGDAREMMPEAGDPLSGMLFVFQTALERGRHSFRFRFDDGAGHEVESEEYSGPLVE